MPYITDDPAADYSRYEAEQEREMERLPICHDCGEPITGEILYQINDEYICPECMSAYVRYVDDLID